jgi:hypothetical protein
VTWVIQQRQGCWREGARITIVFPPEVAPPVPKQPPALPTPSRRYFQCHKCTPPVDSPSGASEATDIAVAVFSFLSTSACVLSFIMCGQYDYAVHKQDTKTNIKCHTHRPYKNS